MGQQCPPLQSMQTLGAVLMAAMLDGFDLTWLPAVSKQQPCQDSSSPQKASPAFACQRVTEIELHDSMLLPLQGGHGEAQHLAATSLA